MPDLSGSKVDGGLRSAQFMGIVAEILENSGGSLSQFKESAERAIEAVESFDLEHLEILVALEQSRNSSAFVKVSERALRSDFFTPSIAFFAGFA
jgi:Tfp pilus assembly protein PilP